MSKCDNCQGTGQKITTRAIQFGELVVQHSPKLNSSVPGAVSGEVWNAAHDMTLRTDGWRLSNEPPVQKEMGHGTRTRFKIYRVITPSP